MTSVQVGEVLDDAVEPAVPALLSALTGSQSAVVEFLRIDWTSSTSLRADRRRRVRSGAM